MTDMSDPGPDREKGMLVRDGIGRARLRFGAILFETVFQPAYRVEGGMLRPDFATARLRPEGRETAQHVLASLAEGPGAGQAAALARCNLVFLDPETLCYCEDHLMSAAMAPATLDLMLAAVRDAFMMPDQIVWRLPLRVACDAGETIARARAAGIRIALRLGEFNWVESFIPDYKQYLAPKFRDTIVHYSKAKLLFEKKDYAAAMELLAHVDYDDVLLTLNARLMLIKIFYETDEYDALDSLLESMRTYIHRKDLTSSYKSNYQNIIRYTKKLVRVNPYDGGQKSKLKTEIIAANPLTEKSWLLEHLEKL